MPTAIDVLTRALQGDVGARSFLEQTCSIYVLDVSHGANTPPKILGCWTFLQEGLNELDRYESSLAAAVAATPTTTRTSRSLSVHSAATYDDEDSSSCHHHHNDDDASTHNVGNDTSFLSGPAKLLAEMGIRVSRRSNKEDDELVQTCLENGRVSEMISDIVQTNSELRERVIARMAALAFDGNENDYYYDNTTNSLTRPVIRDAFAAAIAANAVSNNQIEEFVGWIMSNKRSLPPFAVSCVLLHVSLEVLHSDNDSSEGTNPNVKTLQRLSTRTMMELLGPILRDALQWIHAEELQRHVRDEDSHTNERISRTTRTASKTIECINAWCRVTGLSMPGLRHILKKADIDLCQMISSMFVSNEAILLDALADWLEEAICPDMEVSPTRINDKMKKDDETEQDDVKASSTTTASFAHPPPFVITRRCMNQMRYIMGVDESSFRSISEQQLQAVECKELDTIIQDLVDSIAMQRVRLVDLSRYQHDANDNSTRLCLALARIGVVLCLGYRQVRHNSQVPSIPTSESFQSMIPNVAMLDFFLKCTSTPSIAVSATVLPILTPVLTTEMGLATQCLPSLQRLAIIPHRELLEVTQLSTPNKSNGSPVFDTDNMPSLVAHDSCGDSFWQFIQFRDTILSDALQASFRGNSSYFLVSCTSAIEEFCGDQASTEQTSFHLEAALHCLSVVSPTVMEMISNDSSSNDPSESDASVIAEATPTDCLENCALALSKKPTSLTTNPLTLLQACRFIDSYRGWFSKDRPPGIFDIAVDLVLTVILLCATEYPDTPFSTHIYNESAISPYSCACQTLSRLLKLEPRHFLTNKAMASLGGAWEASYSACNRSKKWLSVSDRIELAGGICSVLALLQPNVQQETSIIAFSIPSLCCIDAMAKHAYSASSDKELEIILNRLADEVSIVATIVTSFPEPATFICQRAWPTLNEIALKYDTYPPILSAVIEFMQGCLPQTPSEDDRSMATMKEICKLSASLLSQSNEVATGDNSSNSKQRESSLKTLLTFILVVMETYGDNLDRREDLSRQFENVVKKLLDAVSLARSTGMGRRTESGQLAFEVYKSPSMPQTTTPQKEDKDDAVDDNKNLDFALELFLSNLRRKHPAFHDRAIPPNFQSDERKQ